MFELATYFSNLGPLQIAGLFGFFVYILAFAAVQLEHMNGNSAAYSLLNILAATLVAISLVAEFNLSSALIQGSWIAIGLAGLVLRARNFQKNNHQPSPMRQQPEITQ